MRPAVTRISSRGQVVIPAWMRRRLHLAPGDELTVEIAKGRQRTIVLSAGTRETVESLLERGYDWIEKSGTDMVRSLEESREEERLRERRRRRRT